MTYNVPGKPADAFEVVSVVGETLAVAVSERLSLRVSEVLALVISDTLGERLGVGD
jgi:hypothetical protein